MTATHQHEKSRTKWDWATDRIQTFCDCGLMLSDDYDEASYGPPHPECGQAWLIDLAYGVGVFMLAFMAFLTLWLLLA